MDEATTVRLYALALCLVPDENEAVEVFRTALHEADLRLRAARWREQHGLPAAPPLDVLPPLDAEQREHALQLRQRALRLRRLRPWLGAMAAALLAGVVGGLALLAQAAHSGLAADAVWGVPPIAASESWRGLRLLVHRAVISPSYVSVWWEISGPEAGYSDRTLLPQFFPDGTQQAADQVTVKAAGSARLLGHSVFKLPFWGGNRVRIGRQEVGGKPVPFWAEALAERVLDDPDTRAVSLQQTHTQNTLTVRLDSLLTGPSYTALRYSQEGTVTGEYPAIRLDANHLLIPTHTWLITEGNLGRAVPLYDPLPAGVHDIAVEFPRGYGLEQLAPVDMPFAEGTAQVQRSGGFVSGVLRVSADAQYLDRANILTFWDATGQFYAGQVDALQSESQGVELHFMVQVPPNAVLTHWRLDGYRLPDPIIFHLHLPD